MNRCEFESFVLDNYNACADFPWYIYPNYEVFRHANSKKWFAVVMDVPKFRLGLDGTIPDDKIKMLLDMSYHLTDKIKKPRIQR